MKSEKDSWQQLYKQEMNAKFRFSRFLLYGWFGWAPMLLLGFILSPFLYIMYMVQTFSLFKANWFTKRRIVLFVRQGLGYEIPKN